MGQTSIRQVPVHSKSICVAIRLIRAFLGDLPRLNEINLDLRVLGWALAISVLAGILVGLSPAIATLRRDLRPSGEEGGRSVSGGAATRRIRRAFVVADFALAIVLLAGAGLFVRSWWYVNSVDPGFSPERVLGMDLSASTFSIPAQRTDLYQRVLEAIQAVPGVEDAGIIGDLFIANSRDQVVTVERDDGTVSERMQFARDEVSADFFKTPLLRGRFFSIGDSAGRDHQRCNGSALVAGAQSSGQKVQVGPAGFRRLLVHSRGRRGRHAAPGLEREPFPQMFVSLAQSPPPRTVDIFTRTSSEDAMAMAGALRAAVRRVEKNALIYGVAPLERQFGTYLAQRRFLTSLLTGFSLVALLMDAIGIYGVIQYSIATRTQEIGIRMAVGAQAGEIFRMILGEGLKLSLTGLMLGMLGALWLGQWFPSAVRCYPHGSSNLRCGVVIADRGRRRGLLLPRATRNEY